MRVSGQDYHPTAVHVCIDFLRKLGEMNDFVGAGSCPSTDQILTICKEKEIVLSILYFRAALGFNGEKIIFPYARCYVGKKYSPNNFFTCMK